MFFDEQKHMYARPTPHLPVGSQTVIDRCACAYFNVSF